jgi:16S rRNA (guanine966-N2)-methyltransferase
MRIVGGSLGGRRVPAPPGSRTRPTAERVREALASRLDARGLLAGARVLDLFAGTGALSFEALSRGAERAVLVDRDRRVVAATRQAAEALGLGQRAEVVAHDLLGRPEALPARLGGASGSFDLVFADPPYAELRQVPRLLAALLEGPLLAPGATIVLEHASRDALPAMPETLALDSTSRYGDTAVSLFLRDVEPTRSAP